MLQSSDKARAEVADALGRPVGGRQLHGVGVFGGLSHDGGGVVSLVCDGAAAVNAVARLCYG